VNVTVKQLLAVVTAFLVVASSAYANVEAVYVRKVLDSSDQVIIQRRNSEVWLLEYGVGVISIWQYEGKVVLIKSPGLFAGVGSEIILPDDDEDAPIWSSEEIQ
jgi:hypothetical protein